MIDLQHTDKARRAQRQARLFAALMIGLTTGMVLAVTMGKAITNLVAMQIGLGL